jgi:hypothetical protein
MEQKNYLILSLLVAFVLLAGPTLAAESIYAHISFVDNGATIVREDGSKDQAVVNQPLAPGDTVITSAGGRCELQFDNGTVVRLDKGTRLRIATVLVPSLTSSWNITTLELERGQLVALPQSYAREMFQVITHTAAANLKTQVRAYIRLDDDGGTSFFSDGGKFQLLYGADSRSLKKATVKSNHPVTVSAGNMLTTQVEKRDIEFMAWNEYVDKHFKELHYGINKMPAKLKFENTVLTYWAEKWSSLVGEWIYDELFGYVWRPADERFAYAARPFFHADFTRIGGELFLVPQQDWGWVPAHMGTWVWMSRGWTWIPGAWFHSGIVDYAGLYSYPITDHYYGFPTFDYYWHKYRFWMSGWNSPAAGEPGLSNRSPRNPELPAAVITLVKKVIKAPDGYESKRLATGKVGTPVEGVKLPVAPKRSLQAAVADVTVKSGTAAAPAQEGGGMTSGIVLYRDWNPDSRWAARNDHTIVYSSSRNAVVCPELKISSDRMHIDRHAWGNETRGWRRDDTQATSSGQPADSTNSGEAAGEKAAAPPPVPADLKEKDGGR